MHRPPLDSFRQLNLLRHLSADFTGLHTEFGLCMPEYQGRRFRALPLHSTYRIISSPKEPNIDVLSLVPNLFS